MTVASDLARQPYATNGVTNGFPVPFYFLEDGDLAVTHIDSAGVETLLTLTTDYTVSGAGDEDGGAILTTTTYASNGYIVIKRNVAITQETALPANTPMPSDSVEKVFDRLTMIAQQQQEQLGRALVAPDTGRTVAPLTPQAGALVGWNDTLDGFKNVPIPDAEAGTYVPGFTGSVATRTIGDKLRETISLADFGAVGDGTTDDADEIQAAFDYANAIGGARIEGAPKTFSVSRKLLMYSNTELDLKGGTLRRDFNTSITGDGLLGCFDAANPTFQNVTIRNGTLDANCDSFATASDCFSVVRAQNLRFHNVTFLDVNDDHAIDAAGIDGMVVDSCRFLGFNNASGTRAFSDAIQIDPGIDAGGLLNKNIFVTNCYFGPNAVSGFGAWGVGVGNHGDLDGGPGSENIMVAGNTFDSCGYAGVHGMKWRGVSITGNTFVGCNTGVLIDPRVTAAGTVEGCTGVSVSGNTFRNNTTGNPDINMRTPGASMTTAGKQSDISVVGNVFTGCTGNAVNAEWVTGLTVTGNRQSGGATFFTMRFCNGVNVCGNSSQNLSTNFVYVNEGTETSFAGLGLTTGISISNNNAVNVGFRGVHVNCAAVNVTITGNTFIGVSSVLAGREGILCDTGSSNISITDNQILDNSNTNKPALGISLSGSCVNAYVADNTAFGSTAPVKHLGITGSTLEHRGSGTPLNVISAPIGSRWMRTDGGTSTTLYVKESGTGAATGWVAK